MCVHALVGMVELIQDLYLTQNLNHSDRVIHSVKARFVPGSHQC
jgi:hypothetical protein